VQRYPICSSELAFFLKIMTFENLPSDYPDEPRLRDLSRTVWNWPRLAVLGLVRLYQMTLSRALPPDTCRFYPSCSHYGYQAVYKYGVFKGGAKAIWRVLRCNPFNPGGYDPVL
jgi:putative membrane protein insertion efficiency factor